MSDHKTTLVPIESWSYQSPELRAAGTLLDVGLLAESLIYYDKILLNVANQPQLAELLRWIIKQNAYADFLALIREGSIVFYEYSFWSGPAMVDGRYVLCNIQDPSQVVPNSFEQRVLHHPDVKSVVPEARDHDYLCKLLRDRVIEVKASQFADGVKNADLDHRDPERAALVMQAFLDELYEFRKLGEAPQIKVQLTQNADKSVSVSYNCDFNRIASLAGEELVFGTNVPLQASVISNRLVWSAANQRCDLYLPSPISTLVGDKLYEVDVKMNRTSKVIEKLKVVVEFPDIRRLVNEKRVTFVEVLKLRKRANRFRNWLQDESERDRDAIIAYHHEVAKEAGLVNLGRKTLRLMGVLGPSALSGALGTVVSGPEIGAVVGLAAGGLGFLADIGSRMGEEWKPVVFGRWMNKRIQSLLGSK